MSNTPIIKEMQVIPVAGYDSMLMTLSGAHAPCFTRNLVVLHDNAGHTGIGEIHGGDYTCDCLNAMKPLVEGQPVSNYREVLQKIHKIAKRSSRAEMTWMRSRESASRSSRKDTESPSFSGVVLSSGAIVSLIFSSSIREPPLQ